MDSYDKALQELVQKGLVKCVGVDSNGTSTYQITKEGLGIVDFFKENPCQQ